MRQVMPHCNNIVAHRCRCKCFLQKNGAASVGYRPLGWAFSIPLKGPNAFFNVCAGARSELG
jgi:hypothetical protein